jgi:hypothetical protein
MLFALQFDLGEYHPLQGTLMNINLPSHAVVGHKVSRIQRPAAKMA